jgi:hypothetical protein
LACDSASPQGDAPILAETRDNNKIIKKKKKHIMLIATEKKR